MTTKTFQSQFRKDLYILTRAANSEVDLEYGYPKLFKKVKKYFVNQGVEFYDDPETDYRYILSLIGEELKIDVPA